MPLNASCLMLDASSIGPVALLVLLARVAPALLVAAGLLLDADRLGLLVLLAGGAVAVALAFAARHRELADLVLAVLGRLPAPRQLRLVLRHFAHPEDQ